MARILSTSYIHVHVHTRTVNVCAMLMISYVILKYAPYDWLKYNPRLQKKNRGLATNQGQSWVSGENMAAAASIWRNSRASKREVRSSRWVQYCVTMFWKHDSSPQEGIIPNKPLSYTNRCCKTQFWESCWICIPPKTGGNFTHLAFIVPTHVHNLRPFS